MHCSSCHQQDVCSTGSTGLGTAPSRDAGHTFKQPKTELLALLLRTRLEEPTGGSTQARAVMLALQVNMIHVPPAGPLVSLDPGRQNENADYRLVSASFWQRRGLVCFLTHTFLFACWTASQRTSPSQAKQWPSREHQSSQLGVLLGPPGISRGPGCLPMDQGRRECQGEQLLKGERRKGLLFTGQPDWTSVSHAKQGSALLANALEWGLSTVGQETPAGHQSISGGLQSN